MKRATVHDSTQVDKQAKLDKTATGSEELEIALRYTVLSKAYHMLSSMLTTIQVYPNLFDRFPLAFCLQSQTCY
jgi:hypothetical protein